MTSPRPPITVRQLRGAVSRLRFDRNVTGVGFDFDPSMGLVAKAVDRLGLEFQSFREPLTTSIKVVIGPSIRKNFDVGGRPTPWEPLAEFTIKQRGYDAWPILVRTGKLKKTASSFKIWDVGKTSAIVRDLPSNVWYGKVHQAGYGGFARYMRAAEKELGSGASFRETTARAFELLDERRGGAKGQAKIEIPQRQFVMYQDEDIPKIQAIFFAWLSEKVEEAEEMRGLS
jgi:phage gpG-like protein